MTRSFNAHTHQWVLFFSSGGKAFREKVWRLPEAGPTAKGRALVNLLPELGSDTITTVLPLPQDETLWESLHLVFATAKGNVRRNRLSDFRNVRAAGLIAMKLDEGDRLIGVATCREGDDDAAGHPPGPLHPLPDHRRQPARVRRPRQFRRARHQAAGRRRDEVISLSVLRHVEATPDERAAYLKLAAARRRAGRRGGGTRRPSDAKRTRRRTVPMPPERFEELAEREEFLLTVTDSGFGKRSSAYEYRVTGRGGQGIANITLTAAHRQGGGRHASGAAGRRRDAGHRRRPADPRARRPGAHHRPRRPWA